MRAILSLVIALIATTVCLAGDQSVVTTKPVTLNIAGSMPITLVLDTLAKESSTAIVYDNTVKGTIGDSQIKLPSLDAMFGFLKSKDPGLTVQSLYLPADKPLPSAADLVGVVSALKQIEAIGLVVVGSDENSTITFSHGSAPDTAPAGMKLVYLVTNETTRAQMAATALAAQKATPAGAAAQNPAGTPGAYLPGTSTDAQAAARRAQRAAARRLQQQQLQQQQQQQQLQQPAPPPAPN